MPFVVYFWWAVCQGKWTKKRSKGWDLEYFLPYRNACPLKPFPRVILKQCAWYWFSIKKTWPLENLPIAGFWTSVPLSASSTDEKEEGEIKALSRNKLFWCHWVDQLWVWTILRSAFQRGPAEKMWVSVWRHFIKCLCLQGHTSVLFRLIAPVFGSDSDNISKVHTSKI